MGANCKATINPVKQPGSSYQRYDFTSEFAKLVWERRSVGPVHLGEAVQRELGISPGGLIHYTDAASNSYEVLQAHIGGSPNSSYRPRLASFDAAFLTEIPPVGDLQICYFESVSPLTEELYGAVVANFYPNRVELLRNTKLENEYGAAVQAFENRASRTLTGGLALLICAAVVLLTQVRKTEYAIYRSFHARADQVLVMVIAEAALVVWVPLAIVYGVGGYLGSSDLVPLVSGALLADYLRLLAGALLAP